MGFGFEGRGCNEWCLSICVVFKSLVFDVGKSVGCDWGIVEIGKILDFWVEELLCDCDYVVVGFFREVIGLVVWMRLIDLK